MNNLTQVESLRTPRERAKRAIHDKSIGRLDALVLEWQYELCGSFRQTLWELIAKADDDNLEKLSRGFPLEVMAVKAFRYTWMGERLRQQGLLD